ncbi:uncharacterized protein LOC111084115, partial [Limulus polyphemus]|uniref:Uncharacterized protein LOC111084115 n=1 Tax=Limulus polyphemus TaxID=6850 RepID=A0ABM1RZ04_LIMPO
DLLFKTSKLLFHATSGKFYFREVTLVVPSSGHNWTNRPDKVISSRWYSTADIRIGPPDVLHGSAPYTVGSTRCGQQGLFIYLPTNFLLTSEYLDKPNVLFRQWMTYSKGICENKRHRLMKHNYNRQCSEGKEIGFREPQPNLTRLKYFETPKFRIVQADKSPRCVLILDTSGSMHSNPMIKLRESATRFIRKLEDGTFIGVVSFGFNAKIELELTKKTVENEGDIIEKIPKEAEDHQR